MAATRILVVANRTASSPALVDALRRRAQEGTIHCTLLVPVPPPSRREGDEERLAEAVETWREAGIPCDGLLGDEDPLVAVLELWDPMRFDEIVVSTLPGQVSKWTRWDLPHRLALATDARVTHVVDVRQADRVPTPPPPRERSPLGPLAVLAWGGRPETPTRPRT